jgi:hypothetical protein
MSISENANSPAGAQNRLGSVPFLDGLDKFFNVLTNWEVYLSPMAVRLPP